MELEKSPYRIKLVDAEQYTLNSVDNIEVYDIEYFQDNRYRPTSKHGIRIFENGQEIRSAIVCETGGATGIHIDSVQIIDNVLYLCCCDSIYSLTIPNLDLNWNKRIDPATCFGIYTYKGDFIVHGELQITRIDMNGLQKWTFGARDIFVTQDGTDSFKIKEDKIYLRDWAGFDYVLDENGKEINE
ncbi:hypothetical protein [Crocinitomix catalasitica]|uniref:hypothetical protein n=1 Tax=Crocinitomix catalasitica TaxID=184607 RepID=UPI0006843BC6|nr:hypothetical protein [Crocinitomix catalasitica]